MKAIRLPLLTIPLVLMMLSTIAMGQEKFSEKFKNVNAIDVEMVSAEVIFEVVRGKTVTVEVTHGYDPDRYQVRVEQRGSKLYLEEDFYGNRWRGDMATWHVKLPKEMDITYESASGDFSLTGVEGDLDVSTASGDITLADIKGDLELDNASGRVEITNATGRFDIDNASGRIRMAKVNGDIEINNASGSVRITESTGTFEVDNASGDINVDDVEISGRSSFSTASGDIDVTLAKTLKNDLRMSTASGDATLNYNGQPITGTFEFETRKRSGRIVSPYKFDSEEEFPREDRDSRRYDRDDRRYGRNALIRKSFTRQGDSPRVEMRSASGTIELKES